MYRKINARGFDGRKHLLFLRVLVRSFILLSLVFATGLSTAQVIDQPSRRGSRVIDDTTKQVYGPNTSRYYYERDVFFNRQTFHSIDTFSRNFHRNASYVQRYHNLYQDLGNIGSAIRPLYYETPANIGVTAGFHSYDLYWDTEQIRYFDTKSPYTNMNLILGGKGRSLTRATFSRNINPRWNFGFTFRGLFVDKQIQRRGKADRFVRSNYYDAYTAYENKDSTYRLFLNFQRTYHRVNEFGGVQIDEDEFNELGLKAYFDENVLPWLTTAQSDELRMNVHLFHQYKIGSALQLYHIADRSRQKNKFLDLPNSAQNPFFNHFDLGYDSVRDASTFKVFRNEVGIKGNLAKLFYNGYYAIRHYEHSNNHLLPDTVYVKINDGDTTRFDVHGNESYFGGRMSLRLDSLVEVNGWAELIIPNGNYRIEGSIRSKWFEASLRQMQYAPGFLTQAYQGSHHRWINDFGNVESTQIKGFLHYKNSVIDFSPGITLTRLRNFVFFDQITEEDTVQQVFPRQSSGNQILTAPEIRFSLTFFRHVTFSSQSIYTLVIENADDAIRVPDLLVNAQLSYDNIFFNGNLDMHAGVDLHWKSSYYAHGYDPAIQQYYTQDVFQAKAFPLVDLFFNAKIKRARIFFKYNNLMQAITKSGYFPTPYYPGQRNVFDFGFDWSFYD
jgi:hypothetical protein